MQRVFGERFRSLPRKLFGALSMFLNMATIRLQGVTLYLLQRDAA
jgi:hypothetical protein